MQSDKKLFAQRLLEKFWEKQKKELAEKHSELSKERLCVREIDGIIQKLYEDKAVGKISDECFAAMSMSLEKKRNSAVKRQCLRFENKTGKHQNQDGWFTKVN